MTRLFLAAGVAALAIAAPATAKPGGGHGGGQAATVPHGGGGGGGGQRAAAVQRAPRAQAVQRGGGGGGGAQRMQRNFAMPRAQRTQRFAAVQRQSQRAVPRMAQVNRNQARVAQREQMRAGRMQVQNRAAERQQLRATRQQAQNRIISRQQLRGNQTRQAQNGALKHQQLRAGRQQAQNRALQRQQLRGSQMKQAQNHALDRQQLRMNGMQAQNRAFERQQLNGRQMQVQQQALARQQLRGNQMQQQTLARQQLDAKGTLAAQYALTARNRAQFQVNNDYASRYYGARNNGQIGGCPPGLAAKNNGCLAPGQAQRLFGAPLAVATGFTAMNALSPAMSYLYPDTSDYYYRYGDGYLYQVNRSNNVIDNLLPLLAGGYMPGQYLPASYMNSYVPDYYGFNSFYPDSQYVCNRYGNGVVYQTDCATGMVQDVIPLYASGYGVGQILPSSYNYYNVPYQYRDMYSDNADTGYWYAPGAIYQYDQSSSMITSVAALLSPGFAVGQQLPMGYDAYNVPYNYRASYYDTPDAWYRYNNGYIYQVDPTTRLVTAIVASLLT
jgi:hypothetical protein